MPDRAEHHVTFPSAQASTMEIHSHRAEATLDVVPTTLSNYLYPKPQSSHDGSLRQYAEIRTGTQSCRRTEDAHAMDLGGAPVDGGARLTWEDLWVTVLDRGDRGEGGGGGWRAILDSSTGYAEPGRILGLMGPSGCGKSTLLDALAGRLSSTTRQSGHILVNGRKQTLAFGTSAYVTQEDVLLTTLTVREAVYYSAQLQLPRSMSKHDKLQRADDTIREMGLSDAVNTRIGGGPNRRGLSGGQRRRVSICLEILTRPSLLFLDEPTSGLDSAASFHVMRRIADLAHHHGQTVVLSVHQPSNEVFGLLDDLYLLTEGKTVYFGPIFQASHFFAACGFPCPSMMNPPDHYLKTINKNFEEEVDKGCDSEIPKTSISESINILVNSYKSSSYKCEVEKRVAKISSQEGQKLARGSEAYFMTQCLLLTQRSMLNMSRDAGYYWLRFAIYIGLAFCLGTIYYNVDLSYHSIHERYTVVVFIGGFLTFMTIGGFPSFVEDLKVFGGERLNGHYGVLVYVISHTLSSIPFLLLTSFIPGVITYFMVGLQSTLSHFFYFAMVLFVLLLIVESLMMVVAGIVSNYLYGIIVGAAIQAVMLLTSGYFQIPQYIPKVIWKYPVHYMTFHKYGNQGFSKNEFIGLTLKGTTRGSTISGLDVLRDIFQMETGYTKWVDLLVLSGMVVLYRILFLGILKFKESIPFSPIVKFSKPTQIMQIISPAATPTR